MPYSQSNFLVPIVIDSLPGGNVAASVFDINFNSLSSSLANVANTTLLAGNNAANTVQVSQNSSGTLYSKSLNFVNTSSVIATVSSNGGDANISFQAIGVIGPQGVQGPTGTGLQGLIGIQGNAGSVQGYTGIQGSQGSIGLQGSTGFGSAGAQGYTGIQGSIGQSIQGIMGSQGTSGTSGTNGTNGTNGSAGVQGYTGIQGPYGIQGSSGALGYSQSFTTNGNTVLPNGLYLVWGYVGGTFVGNNNYGPYSFSTAFPSACLYVGITMEYGQLSAGATIISRSAFSISTATGGSSASGFRYFAVGH